LHYYNEETDRQQAEDETREIDRAEAIRFASEPLAVLGQAYLSAMGSAGVASGQTTLSTTAVDTKNLEVRSRVAGSGTAVRGIGACDAMPTRTARTRWSERRAIRDGIAVGESPAH
jgi:hypothetical protein